MARMEERLCDSDWPFEIELDSCWESVGGESVGEEDWPFSVDDDSGRLVAEL